tara:strand:+ start:852 stop:1109 length:258 start_codon:yes stop_codon:yes gene_type:complete
MKNKLLQKKYAQLIKDAELAAGRKDTISYLHQAEKIRNKINKKLRKTCTKCNGYGYRRISIDGARTCLNCFGKGYLMRDNNKNAN